MCELQDLKGGDNDEAPAFGTSGGFWSTSAPALIAMTMADASTATLTTLTVVLRTFVASTTSNAASSRSCSGSRSSGGEMRIRGTGEGVRGGSGGGTRAGGGGGASRRA